jgi:3-hydroxy-9,10-secoandrosta-1,3,5(10)-triene-9,17-dione monooxygenase reductase component
MVTTELHPVPASPGRDGDPTPGEVDPRPIDSQHFRSVLGHFCSGLTVVSALGDEGPVGFTCQSFFSVSLDPPLIAFSVAHTSTSYPRLKRLPAFCVNVLGSDQAGHSQVLSSKDPAKWTKVAWGRGVAGAVRVHGALAWIDCAPWAEFPAGDHTIVVGRVLDLAADPGRDPLLYFNRRYRGLHPEIENEAQ